MVLTTTAPAAVLGLRAPAAGANTLRRPVPAKAGTAARLSVRASASSREKAVAAATSAATAAMLALPPVADAAQPSLSPSLKNFLLSIVAGGVVLAALAGAVIAVANFDPVKRA